MNIIVLDDEKNTKEDLVEKVIKLRPDANVTGFTDPEQAIAFARTTTIDVAFLDMEMPKISGIDTAKALKAISDTTYIIFATAHEKYALDAFKVRAGGYLMKPASLKEIEEELNQVQQQEIENPKGKVRVQCFGGFDVFCKNGERICFARSKSKELFAYLVNRKGASVSNSELIDILLEGKEHTESVQSSLRKIISDMQKILKEKEIEEIVIRSRNSLAVDKVAIDCDYYAYLKGEVWAINAYHYDYMPDYEWAEEINWYLSNNKDK
ncbi:MAG TPA: response regulator [Lachnospiraceae bacterium]|nr:response regulator [Lachnospiraceae bacterium]